MSDATTFFKIWAANAWAYELELGKVERAVLIALIFHLDPETWQGYPAQERLAELTGWSKRSVWEALGALESRGLISRFPRWRDDGTHRREVDLTRVNLPAEVASRYRRNAWEAPDEEMINPADAWLDDDVVGIHSQPVRPDLLAEVAKERSTYTSVRKEIKRSLARAASRSAENGRPAGIDEVLEKKPGQ